MGGDRWCIVSAYGKIGSTYLCPEIAYSIHSSARQDLSTDLLAIARKEGCRISMGTDSYGPSQLEFMELGVAATIRATLDPKKILSYMSVDQLLEWTERVRGR